MSERTPAVRHLEAIVCATRLRLERANSVAAASGATPGSGAALALPGADREAIDGLDAALAGAIAARDAAAAEEPTPPLAALSARLGLSSFEEEVLGLCLAMELDTRTPVLCAEAHGDPRRTYPTFGLALGLSEDPVWDAVSPGRPLRYWNLVELSPADTQPLTAWSLRIDERILSYAKGVHHVDVRWMPLLERLDTEVPLILPESQATVAAAIVTRLQSTPLDEPIPLLQIVGRDTRSAERVACTAARALGLQLYRLDAELLPGAAADFDALLRLWQREVLLAPVALFVNTQGITEANAAALDRFLARIAGVVFVGSRDPRAAGARTYGTFEVGKPTALERRATWRALLGPEAGETADRLSAQFVLDLPMIDSVVTNARRNGGLDVEHLWSACVDATMPRVEGLARRIAPRARWEDLVLPAEDTRALREIAAQVHHRSTVYETWGFGAQSHRGLALTALFAGESGTGKTLAAEVLASELRLQLLCIDLSAVVSKYIGETEKNLRRVFDAAEDSGAILFFDEADALFGKRSEVKDSHDRYANIETNYLLQRMEAYRGLAILATNMKGALDSAFMRRLRFYVRFAFPAERERAEIWRRAFPPETPTRGLDAVRLGSFVLTGASIRNIALNAAFLAAHARTPVTMPVVLEAVRAELKKLERRVSESNFHWKEPISQGDGLCADAPTR